MNLHTMGWYGNLKLNNLLLVFTVNQHIYKNICMCAILFELY